MGLEELTAKKGRQMSCHVTFTWLYTFISVFIVTRLRFPPIPPRGKLLMKISWAQLHSKVIFIICRLLNWVIRQIFWKNIYGIM